jgi:ferredoxin/coenzyme F420-reducing hydrogenase delta subunit
MLAAMPWLPPLRRMKPATVDLDHCNGCGRCVADCPYTAIRLEPRSDGLPFAFEVEVDPARCVACGICMGSCPSSSPFRRSGELVTGIDLPDYPLAQLRADVIHAADALGEAPGGGRVLTLACSYGAGGEERPGRVLLPCVAMVPPSLIDYILSRGLADGVCVAGCAERDCHNRLGRAWTEQRFARERDPYLRERVPRDRILTVWAGPTEISRLDAALAGFGAALAGQPAYEHLRPLTAEERAEAERKAHGPRAAE